MVRAIHLVILALLTVATADRLQTRPEARAEPPLLVASAEAMPVLARDEGLQELAMATWPEDQASALIILACESSMGEDPDAWRTDRPDGGPYQINRESWERFFFERHGWTWDEITYDPVINTAAARIIYDRTGDWSAWTCEDSLSSVAQD